jgi:hypothetical protein
MNLYLVHGHITTANSFEAVHRWCGTQAECAVVRKEFIERGADKKDLQTQEVNVPTDKAGLLAFLNRGSEPE